MHAETDEIVLMNHLKALFNSVRSITLINKDSDVLGFAEQNFVISRFVLFERNVCGLKKLEKRICVIVKKGLSELSLLLPQTPAKLVLPLFCERVIKPLKLIMLEKHKTVDERKWVKAWFVIMEK